MLTNGRNGWGEIIFLEKFLLDLFWKKIQLPYWGLYHQIIFFWLLLRSKLKGSDFVSFLLWNYLHKLLVDFYEDFRSFLHWLITGDTDCKFKVRISYFLYIFYLILQEYIFFHTYNDVNCVRRRRKYNFIKKICFKTGFVIARNKS